MRSVYKYPVNPDVGMVWMPNGAEILSVGIQGARFFVWALVNPSEVMAQRCVRIYGTGHQMTVAQQRFLNTFHVDGLVFHAFEEFPL